MQPCLSKMSPKLPVSTPYAISKPVTTAKPSNLTVEGLAVVIVNILTSLTDSFQFSGRHDAETLGFTAEAERVVLISAWKRARIKRALGMRFGMCLFRHLQTVP